MRCRIQTLILLHVDSLRNLLHELLLLRPSSAVCAVITSDTGRRVDDDADVGTARFWYWFDCWFVGRLFLTTM